MKRIYRTLIVLAILVVALAAITITADATELKTGIGIVDAARIGEYQ